MIEKKIKNYRLLIFKDKEELTKKVSDFICDEISYKLQKKERFQMCLSGGSTPKSVYSLISKKNIEWSKVDVFLGDERCVDPESENSNTLMLKRTLFQNFSSQAYFYQIFNSVEINEEISKDLFLSKIKEKCSGYPPIFDLTLLGLGDDGHTASLFPNQRLINDDDLIIYTHGKGLKRISLTPKILSASSKVIFLVSGNNKKIALERLISEDESPDRTPAKLIKSNSEISIFCDSDASIDLLD